MSNKNYLVKGGENKYFYLKELLKNSERKETMSAGNGFINNEQRKAFGLIADRKFDEAENLIRSKSEIVEKDIEEMVKRKFGVDVLDSLIKVKEKELEELEDKRVKIAGTTSGASYFGYNSKLQKEKDKMISLYNLDLRDIKTLRSDSIAKIWASSLTTEALHIIEKINDVVKESYKKIDEVKPQIVRELKEINKKSLNE
jgi:predicted AlkP superfamily phosphohydrolase/phosphomutase